MTESANNVKLKNPCGLTVFISLLFVIISNVSELFLTVGTFDSFKIINEVFKIGFPMLMMWAGAVMLSDDRWLSVKNVYKKALLSVLIPVVFWSILYALFNIWYEELSFKNALLSVIKAYSQPVSGHLWLAYCFIAFLVLLPLFRLFTKKADEKLITYGVVIWLVSGVVLPFLSSVNEYFTLTSDANINIYLGFLGFFLLGYFVKIKRFNFSFLTLGFLSVLCIGANITLSLYFSSRNVEISSALLKNTSPLNTLAAFFVYLLIEKTVKKLQITFNQCSIAIGIYFCHMIFAMVLKRIIPIGGILSFVICLVISLILSFFFILLVKKIKFLSFIISGIRQ